MHDLTTGWRPRRSIVFCSWGAEEYGLIASTEWVENFAKVLSHRSIAYLNVDVAVDGTAPLFDLSIIKRSPNFAIVNYDKQVAFF